MPNSNDPEIGNILLFISSIYQSMTKTEKKIADAILKDPHSAVYSTVTDMAETTSSGETSVLRLCRKLGFHSYQAFKLSLAKELAYAANAVPDELDNPGDLKALARKLTTANQAVLENTLSLLDVGLVERSVEAIAAANKLLIIGVSASGNAAMDAKFRFMRLGLPVDAVTDSHVMAMSAILTDKGDVVIGISTSGSTKDVVDAMRIAKNKGAFIICLTSQARSPLAQLANIHLLTSSRETPLQGGAFSTKISQIHVLDILSMALSSKLDGSAAAAIEQTAQAVVDKLY